MTATYWDSQHKSVLRTQPHSYLNKPANGDCEEEKQVCSVPWWKCVIDACTG